MIIKPTMKYGGYMIPKIYEKAVLIAVMLLFPVSCLFSGWQDLTSPTVQDLNDITFRDATTAYICGDYGSIFKTTDGGTNWNQQTSGTTSDLEDIFFLDDNNAWMVGESGTIINTTNGGQVWAAQNSPTGQLLLSVSFSSSSVGVACGYNGAIVRTSDGGANWSLINSPATETLNSIDFTDANTAFIVGSNGNILKSTDGGQSWTVVNTTTGEYLTQIYFFDQNLGYIVGEEGIIYKTTDGGGNWTAKTSGTNRHLYSVHFPSSNRGYAAGSGGTVLITTDAGENWSVQHADEDNTFHGVYFNDDDNGFLAGTGGRLMKTTDAGAGDYLSLDLSDPDGGEHWIIASMHNIIWSMTNVVDNIKIEYSTNNGSNWSDVATVPVTNLYYSWTIPNTPSTSTLVRISDEHHPGVNDVSPAVFTIAPSNVTLTAPNGGEALQANETTNITWTSQSVAEVRIEFTSNGGSSWTTIVSDVNAGNGIYAWTVPDLASNQCLVKITDEEDTDHTDQSDSYFSIKDIDFTAPSDAESISANENYTIEWTHNSVDMVDIAYSIDHGSNWLEIAFGLNAGAGQYVWAVPDISADIMMKIYDADNTNIIDQISVNISNESGITLSAPDGGESWPSGAVRNITWTSENVDYVDLEYTIDNGQTWHVITTGVVAALGFHAWTLPNDISDQCKVMIYDNSNELVVDLSDDVFEIFDGSLPILEVDSPNGGEEYQSGSSKSITWDSYLVSTISIDLTTDNGQTWNNIAGGIDASDGWYLWTVPATASSYCKVRISDESDPAKTDESNDAFSIHNDQMSLDLLSPDGGEIWYSGENRQIKWTESNVNLVDIDYSTDNGSTWFSIETDFDASLQVYNWQVPRKPGENCLVRLSHNLDNTVSDQSEESFSIYGVNLLQPDGGEVLLRADFYNIRWETFGVTNLRLEYSTNSGANWTTIKESYPASAGFYNWFVPNKPSKYCRVRIMDVTRSSLYDESASDFEITGLILDAPATDDVLIAGTNYEIKWRSENIENIKISYTYNGGHDWITIISHTPAVPGKFLWRVPRTPSGNCIIKLECIEDPSIQHMNLFGFSIVGEGLVLHSPNGGEEWEKGTDQTISWSAYNVDMINIEYSPDAGDSWHLIQDNISAADRSFTWPLPNSTSVEALVRITDSQIPGISDESDGLFRVTGDYFDPPHNWRYARQTGNNAVIVVPDAIGPMIGDRPIGDHDLVGVFFRRGDEYVCAGYGSWVQSQNLAVTVWADNPRTPLKDGFYEDEDFLIKVWDAVEGREYLATATYASGPDYYTNDGVSILASLKTHDELVVPLDGGMWSLISSNLKPHDLSVETIMAGVLEEMDYMKDDNGNVYYPDESINTIDQWDIMDGYQIYMKEYADLTLTGARVNPSSHSFTFQPSKWYIISYLPHDPMEIHFAFASILDEVLLVKDEKGNVFFPQYNIDQIDKMQPGEGYKICTREAVTFLYPEEQAGTMRISEPSNKLRHILMSQKYLPEHESTGSSSILVVEQSDSGFLLSDGDEIGVFAGESVVGSSIVKEKKAVITIWGDNPATSEIFEGAMQGENLTLKYLDVKGNREYDLLTQNSVDLLNGRPIENGLKYSEDGIWLTQVKSGSPSGAEKTDLNGSFTIECVPFPLRSSAQILYTVPIEGNVRIELHDNLGRLAGILIDEYHSSGAHSCKIGTEYIESTGIYYLIMEACGRTVSKKIIAVK